MEETGYLVDGLNRTLQVVIPAAESSEKMDQYLVESGKKVNIKGFRPGKVPLNILRNRFGRHLADEILKELIKDHSEKAIKEKKDRILTQPEVVLPDNAVEVLLASEDLKFNIKYEVVPEIDIGDLSDIEVELPLVKVEESKVEAILRDMADQNRTFETRGPGEVSEKGDQVEVSLIDKSENSNEVNANKTSLVLGSSNLFGSEEEKLIGAKVGDIRELSILMPTSDPSKQAEETRLHYSATILNVSKPNEPKIDEEFAMNLGFESLEQLKEQVRSAGNKEFEMTAKSYKWMQIQKKLLEKLDFPVSEKMVEKEFNVLWQEFLTKQKTAESTSTDLEESEQENKKRIKNLAQRQVRMFHICGAVASKQNIEVSAEEIDQSIQKLATSETGQIDQGRLKTLKENQDFVSQVQWNVLEQKVFDYLASNVKSTNKTMSDEELKAAIEKCNAELESMDVSSMQNTTD